MSATPVPTSLRRRLAEFFYAEEVPYGLALIRICLPLSLLGGVIARWPHARELYSTDGSPAPLWTSFGYPDLLPIPSAPLAIALCTIHLIAHLTLCVGWMSRTSALFCAVLTAYLGALDIIGTVTKFTCIATHAFLILSLSHCGDIWSVDALVARRRQAQTPLACGGGYPRSPAWPRRLIQLLMAVIYFAAAITKMQTPTYFSGDQLYFWLLTDVNYLNPVGELMSLWPPMLVGMGLITITWEMVFPFVCWRGNVKAVMLAIGALFHLMTLLMLGLLIFPFVCLSMYWAFLDEADMQRLAGWLRHHRRRQTMIGRAYAAVSHRALPQWRMTPAASGLAFATTLAIMVAISLEAEKRLDPYGLRRPEGPYALQPIDPDRARLMFTATEPLRPQDQLLGFDIGSQTLGGMLANSRRTFQQGEQAVVQCSVVPPHEDMWVEVNLHDNQDRMLLRNGQVMPREKIRSHFHFPFSEAYAPGEYDFVLKMDGKEVSRRRVTLNAPGSQRVTTAAIAR